MMIACVRDGECVDRELLEEWGFTLNEQRDVRGSLWQEEGDFGSQDGTFVYNFVGFLVNQDNDMLAVFPKHFPVRCPEEDAALLFSVISRHRQRHPDKYLGALYGRNYQSDYPFSAFFGIYDYYKRFGLYVEDRSLVKSGCDGKISWRDTIRKGSPFLSGGKVTLFPLYHREKYYFSNFLTECMIYAIDVTIEKFGVFLGMEATGRKRPEYDFTGNRQAVLEELSQIRQQVFRDNLIQLLDHLYAYFSQLKEGGSYYFKHYTFSSVWEDMVRVYLEGKTGIAFEKPAFHPNLADPDSFFAPDYYGTDGTTQYVLDAKYYQEMREMNYKQIAYCFFLQQMREKAEDAEPQFKQLVSALLLPGEKRESRIHFQMDPRFHKDFADMIIGEEYLNIREVMEYYIEHTG